METVHIMQGAGLYQELGEDCIPCKIKRKKFIEAAFGPVQSVQLTLAPPMFYCQMDLFGPYKLFVPGKEIQTRATTASKAVEGHVMICVCPTTRLVNMQLIETGRSCDIISGITRLACEVGIPKRMYIDQSRAEMFALNNIEFDFRDFGAGVKHAYGIEFEICPVGGHNAHGQVERVIRSVQESFDEAGFQTRKYTATALQTLAKLVENQYNALPLGYHQLEKAGGTPLLKLICPNHLRVGRINSRVLDGPMRLPTDKEEYLGVVRQKYDTWFRIWCDTYVPHLLHQPKWFNSDKDLVIGDLVYFLKKDSKLASKWILGMVEEISKGRDGVLREVTVKYCNAAEQRLSLTGDSSKDKTLPRYTIRSVRKMVKVFSLDDAHLCDDIKEFEEKMRFMPQSFQDGLRNPGEMAAIVKARNDFERVVPAKAKNHKDHCVSAGRKQGLHCCVAHCEVSPHYDAHHTTVWEDYAPPEVRSLECSCYTRDEDQLGSVEVPHMCPELLRVEEWDTMTTDYFAGALDMMC